MRQIYVQGVILGVLAAPLAAQDWEIPYRHQEVILDGYLKEWTGVPELVLEPGAAGIRKEGEFGDSDLSVKLRAQWDKEALYLAVDWRDDKWDVSDVKRRDAVFVTPDRRRRDRMLFYDNLKLQIRDLKFDYLLWLSPRIDGRGPFFWHRRLLGMNVRESATRDPVITPREHDDGRVTLEIIFEWKEMGLKPKKLQKQGLPFSIIVSDSDSPGLILESKLDRLKQLEWNGRASLGKK